MLTSGLVDRIGHGTFIHLDIVIVMWGGGMCQATKAIWHVHLDSGGTKTLHTIVKEKNIPLGKFFFSLYFNPILQGLISYHNSSQEEAMNFLPMLFHILSMLFNTHILLSLLFLTLYSSLSSSSIIGDYPFYSQSHVCVSIYLLICLSITLGIVSRRNEALETIEKKKNVI